MRVRISKRAVDSLEAGDRDRFIWDTELPGFGVKMTPKGGRIYVLQYSHARHVRRITIGRHGIDVSPEQARLEAQRLRGLVASGESPLPARVTRSVDVDVATLGRRYLEDYAAPHKKPSGVAQDRRNLANHVVPLIGKSPVRSVERLDIARLMRDIAAGKTAKDEKTKRQGRRIVRGGEIVANRVQALLSKMFALAEDWKLRAEGTNPCRGAKRYNERRVERFLSTQELARLGAALSLCETNAGLPTTATARKSPQTKASAAALKLLLLTGCRVGEVLSLRWNHIDIERKLLLLPDSKTGPKTVFLSQYAVDLLLSLAKTPGSDFVFAGKQAGKPMVSIRKPWEYLCRAAEIENVRLHDLRHTFASVGAAGGHSLPVIGALLGHSQPSTTNRYAHLGASPLHKAADMIGGQIIAAMKHDT